MRILIFHGYLLSGTGSNVYNARTAEALVALGHEVHLLCQDRHPQRHAFVDAVGDWDEGFLRVEALGDRAEHSGANRAARGGPGCCTVYRPDIGGLLPVYVADHYEGICARTFAQCSDAEVASYVQANVAAVAEVVARARAQVALANHLVMGPVILARALGGEVPYAVKIHGSALEYTVKPQPERFLDAAREGLDGAAAVLVGSLHTAESLWQAIADSSLPARTRLGPPGVDVSRFAPRDARAARAGLRELTARLAGEAADGAPTAAHDVRVQTVARPESPDAAELASAFARDDAAAARELARTDPEHDRLVAFVGKLIVSKGVDLLLAAWPLVLEPVPAARLVVVGFGAYRATLESLLDALAAGDLDLARAIARAGRSLEDPPAVQQQRDEARGERLSLLLAFLDGLQGPARERYLRSARALPERVLWTGRLDHDEIAELLPACEALVVPSTFPESFGMVAAEAAACAVLPVSAHHSGLAEVSDALAQAVPERVANWLSFPLDDAAVTALAERLIAWLSADPELRASTREGLVATVRERWSWEGVARGVIAAARGQLDALQPP